MRNTSRGHRAFSHDELSSLAYDWERVGDPDVEPRWPFKVYLPRTTDDVVRAVSEVRAAGERLIVRGSGHSSNGLVTGDGAAVLLTERLDRLIGLDERELTCTMQAGVALSEIDERLSRRGLGLKVVGDHGDLTAGGFASVGGVSPASHRHGMFVDTVAALEYVDWDGGVHRCSRGDDQLLRVLAGLGRHGVITELTVDVQRVQKDRMVLHNDRFRTASLSEFIRHSANLVRAPGGARYLRGLWLDLPGKGIGQFSAFRETAPSRQKALRSELAAGYHRLIGAATRGLPAGVGAVVKYLGVASMLLPPAYTTASRVERFADDLLDATVGEPTRMLIVFAPAEQYEPVLRELLQACGEVRAATGAIGVVALYVKPIRSAYLSGGDPDARHCELTLYLGVDPARLSAGVLDALVDKIDDVAIAHGALRYLHTRTSTDPERRRQLDPNAQYAQAVTPGEELGEDPATEGAKTWSA